MAREIAHVMGHEGADWLERPEREKEEEPSKMVELLGLKKGETVADLGAGTGYVSAKLAQAVGPTGTVYAIDIQPEMLDILAVKMRARNIGNVKPILGALADPHLPTNAVDMVLMVDVYHELSEPHEMLEAITRGLRTAGRLIFVEYRAEDPAVPIKRVHKMSEAQVRKEAEAYPLRWVTTITNLPRQHIIIFEKKS
jgi:ubiquinone/menaquinone biosynthesis C-methylase UbiE